MQLVPRTASGATRRRAGMYTYRKLQREELAELAATALSVTRQQMAACRAVEDLEEPLSLALADRDGDDDALDDTAQEARNTLAGRSVQAARSEPYTSIFHANIGYLISANHGEQSPRYTDFNVRLEKHLPPDDPVRVATVPAIRAQLASWEASAKAVAEAESAIGRARTDRDRAIAEWELTMERTYGALVELFGKKKAERFFPKIDRRRRSDPEEE